MKQGVSEEIRKALAAKHACYVLITCDEPSEDGQMEVKMTYEGDPILAAYMLQSAHAYIEEEGDDIDEDESGDIDEDLESLSSFFDESRRIE